MDGMSQFLESLSKEDRKALRAEMQKQAEKALKGLYASSSQLKAAARKMVDAALAKETLSA